MTFILCSIRPNSQVRESIYESTLEQYRTITLAKVSVLVLSQEHIDSCCIDVNIQFLII